jgi:hypothetical protein
VDIQELRFFYTVARLHSVSKAAKELNYAQSSVTNKGNKGSSPYERLLPSYPIKNGYRKIPPGI